MHKRAIYIFFAVLSICSCEEVEDLLTFRINDSANITIESTSPLNLAIAIPTPAVTSNSRQEFENNNTKAELVRDVKLEQLKLTITQPSGKSFSFLKSIRIFISTDQEGEMELASLDNISTTSGVLDLVPTTEKLDPFIKAPSYGLRTEIVTDETLTQDVDVLVNLRFKVTADTF